MNLIRNFENRVSEAFGSAPQGYTAPFSFKRLARQAAKQMEAETFVIDGVDTAPALYTVLVSGIDDVAMRPLYPRITQEVVGLVKAQAQTKGYVFVGEPLARFLVDPKLRSGKFAVFAENVDAVTLERLRAEEAAFLSGASAVGGAAADRRASHTRRPTKRPARVAQPVPEEPQQLDDLLVPITPDAPVAVAAAAAPAPESLSASGSIASAPDVIPSLASIPDPLAAPAVMPAVSPISTVFDVPDATAEALDDSASMGLDIMPVDFLDDNVRASQLSVPKIDSVPEVVEVPVTQRRVDPVDAPSDLGAHDESYPVTCVLVDRQTGRTYIGTAPSTPIGRERLTGAIILRDPNVSRLHAQLTYDGTSWFIKDLGSTNGTLVNDVEITQCQLHDGDLVTVGLMNLEFREG